MSTAPLQLPDGRRIEIRGHQNDLSVLGALHYTHGVWEPHITALIHRLVQQDWVCLDIGANIGVHTLGLSALAAQTYAFEPGAETFAFLEANVAAHKLNPVTCIQAATWNTSGKLHLFTAKALAGCAFVTVDEGTIDSRAKLREIVTNPALSDDDFNGQTTAIEAIRLDEWADKTNPSRIDLIKIDVQGAEIEALSGAKALLAKFKPLLIVEYDLACARICFGRSERDLFDFLQELFVETRLIKEDGSLSDPLAWVELKHQLDTGKGQEDLLCIPAR